MGIFIPPLFFSYHSLHVLQLVAVFVYIIKLFSRILFIFFLFVLRFLVRLTYGRVVVPLMNNTCKRCIFSNIYKTRLS